MTNSRKIRSRRNVHLRASIAALALMSAVTLKPLNAQGEEGGESSISQVQTAVEQWVETRRVISDERRNWALGREVLAQRLELVQTEIDSLRARIVEAKGSITDADEKREELVAENEKLKQAATSLNSAVENLESRTKTLLPRLPDPIRDRVKPLSQRLPVDQSETKRSLGERFQNVIGILNEVNKFNREITVTSEVRQIDETRSAEVSAIYLGVGQAYYVSGDGLLAGIGRATEEGWTWSPANRSAAEIQKAIAVHGNDQEPAYVRLPIQLP